jgi:hypothetical protein
MRWHTHLHASMWWKPGHSEAVATTWSSVMNLLCRMEGRRVTNKADHLQIISGIVFVMHGQAGGAQMLREGWRHHRAMCTSEKCRLWQGWYWHAVCCAQWNESDAGGCTYIARDRLQRRQDEKHGVYS